MTASNGEPEQDAMPASEERATRTLPGWKIESLDYPTFRLTLIAKIMDRLTIRLLADRGDITYAEWRAMARLATMTQGGTIGQIADLAWVDKAEVSRAIGSLENKGLVERRPNMRDRRTPFLFLTPTGQARYELGIADRMRFHEQLLDHFSVEDRAQFDSFLEQIGSQLLEMVDIAPAGTP